MYSILLFYYFIIFLIWIPEQLVVIAYRALVKPIGVIWPNHHLKQLGHVVRLMLMCIIQWLFYITIWFISREMQRKYRLKMLAASLSTCLYVSILWVKLYISNIKQDRTNSIHVHGYDHCIICNIEIHPWNMHNFFAFSWCSVSVDFPYILKSYSKNAWATFSLPQCQYIFLKC